MGILDDPRLRLGRLFPFLARLPLGWAYGATAGIGDLDRRRDAAARRAVVEGLVRVWPALGGDEARLQGVLRRHFRMLAREQMDVFTMARMDPVRVKRLVDLSGLSILRAARAGGQGVILVMGHYGRLNLLLLATALAGERLGMLTIPVDETNPDLDPVTMRFLQLKVRRLLGFLGGTWVTLGQDYRQLYKALARGEVMVLLVDALTGQERRTRQLPFLGGELTVARGIERLAARTGARLVYGAALEQADCGRPIPIPEAGGTSELPPSLDLPGSSGRRAGWRVRAEIRPLPEDPKEAMAAAVAELERDVRDDPAAWWLWNILPRLWRPL